MDAWVIQLHDYTVYTLINPRRACAARVTVVGLSVCVCVCLLSNISPMERLFVLKTLSRIQRATKVKNFVGFSLKPLRCRDPALPALYAYARSAIFLRKARMRIVVFTTWWTERANMQISTGLPRQLCVPWRRQKL